MTVVPIGTENRLSRMTERMSSPPPEPTDFRMIPLPMPEMIPAVSAFSSGSRMGKTGTGIKRASEKIVIPARLKKKKRRPTKSQPTTKSGMFKRKLETPTGMNGNR